MLSMKRWLQLYIQKIYSLIVIAAGSLVLGAHLVFTFAYLIPENLISQSISRMQPSYFNALFQQNWHLFSPNPGFGDTELWVRCFSDSRASNWVHPFEEARSDHHRTRVTGIGKLLYVYNNLSSQLLEESQKAGINAAEQCGAGEKSDKSNLNLCINKVVIQSILESDHYGTVKRFATDFCKSSLERSKGFQVRIVSTQPKKYSERNTPSEFGSVSNIELPPHGFLADGIRK